MPAKKSKRIALVKPQFPYVEFLGTTFYLFILIMSTMKIMDGSGEHWVFIILSFCFLIGLYFLTNWRNKKIIIDQEQISIKPLLNRITVIPNSKIEGFEMRETYDRSGLIKNIRIILKNGREIDFIKNCYSNNEYSRLIKALDQSEIRFLGTNELKSKNKLIIGTITKVGVLVAVLLFLLAQLFKIV